MTAAQDRPQERWQHAVSLAGQKPLRFASYTPFVDGERAPVDFRALLAQPVLRDEG